MSVNETQKHILLLHNSNDQNEIGDIQRAANAAPGESDWRIWADQPQVGGAISTLGAYAPFDGQILDAIRCAFAIIYFVGRTGAGPYQQSVEAPQIRQVLEERLKTEEPLRFVPVLLRSGNVSDIPDWAQQFTLVNPRRDLTIVRIWEQIKNRITQPPEQFNPSFVPPERCKEDAWAKDIVSALGYPRNLTIFVGPYATPGPAEMGPSAMTEHLLSQLSLTGDKLGPLLPWPSEAAEWVQVATSRAPVVNFFTGNATTSVGNNPSDLSIRIGDLAARWTAQRPRAPGRKDWNGLLLLTTRVDLAVEAALLSASVRFTRFVPTAARMEAQKDLMMQRWVPGAIAFDANPEIDQSPWVTPMPKPKSSSDASLDSAESVILVKLCGSTDVGGSLVVTASDLFQEAPKLAMLPKQMRACIQSSPQILLGRGFASPLAQLVRLMVLGRRMDSPRILVIPTSSVTNEVCASHDGLCELEMRLMDERERAFLNAMELTALHRTDPAKFLVRLADAL